MNCSNFPRPLKKCHFHLKLKCELPRKSIIKDNNCFLCHRKQWISPFNFLKILIDVPLVKMSIRFSIMILTDPQIQGILLMLIKKTRGLMISCILNLVILCFQNFRTQPMMQMLILFQRLSSQLLEPCCRFIITWWFFSLEHGPLINGSLCNKLFCLTTTFCNHSEISYIELHNSILVHIESAFLPLILPSLYLQVNHVLKNFYVDKMIFLSIY